MSRRSHTHGCFIGYDQHARKYILLIRDPETDDDLPLIEDVSGLSYEGGLNPANESATTTKIFSQKTAGRAEDFFQSTEV